ncbi:MAG: C45 family autoproteolytic acyltransferase/hydrolase, partial [Gammaproteobacteria bacterium]|nr:C45 family autoproteolytic acyltransferase/hydrolase [Gammaproteobacteria bacterium]
QIWHAIVQPYLDKGWTTLADAEQLFGRRTFDASSHRMKEMIRGLAEAVGWSTDKVALQNQSFIMSIYQAKLHSFAGCSSILAWGKATPHGGMITARNLDWSESFLPFPLYLTVCNPTDGSNSIANLSWPGYLLASSMVNEKGVYMDVHDGTSMGGNVVYLDRASILNAFSDLMVECDHAEAVSNRLNTLRNDASWIFTVADSTPNGFSYEAPTFDSRRHNADGDTMAIVNSYMNPDWAIHKRETMSNSLRRFDNLTDRLAEAHGKIDANKAMEIFDNNMFNDDGTFKKNGGATKPKKFDADITVHQIVTDLSELKVWLKIPQKTDWREVDLKKLFTG